MGTNWESADRGVKTTEGIFIFTFFGSGGQKWPLADGEKSDDVQMENTL